MQLIRQKDDGESTVGIILVNGQFECFTLEDTHNEPKVYGQTRIPEGKYEIKLRDEGGMTKKYGQRHSDIHKGMLWLQDVENFEWVYIHIGNTAEHTDGCILVGDGCTATTGNQSISHSTTAYKRLYTKVIAAFDNGEDVTIEVI